MLDRPASEQRHGGVIRCRVSRDETFGAPVEVGRIALLPRHAALEQSIEKRNAAGPKKPAVAAERPGGGKIKDPGALAAFIGAKKYSKKTFQKMAAAGRKNA